VGDWRPGGLRFAFLIEPPFCYRTADGAVTGCDVELARRIGRQIGADAFDPIETEFATLLPGLVDGRWHMTTGLFITEERRRQVDFSRPIWALSDGLLVRAGNPHGIAGYASIAKAEGLRLGVVTGQVQHETALLLGVPAERIRTFDTYALAAAAVAAGTIDAYASVATAHRGYLAQGSASGLTVIDVPEREKAAEPGAFAFAKSQTRLKDAIDEALAGFLGSADHRALMTRFGLNPNGAP
jgi:polar amino acid transport system substrate-binding protein